MAESNALPPLGVKIFVRREEYYKLKADSIELQKLKKKLSESKGKESRISNQDGAGIQTIKQQDDSENPVPSTSRGYNPSQNLTNLDNSTGYVETQEDSSSSRVSDVHLTHTGIQGAEKKSELLSSLKNNANVTIDLSKNELHFKNKKMQLPLQQALHLTFYKEKNLNEEQAKEWVNILVECKLCDFISNRQLLPFYQWYLMPKPT